MNDIVEARRKGFEEWVYKSGKCSSISGVEDDYDGKDYYIYKTQWAVWNAALDSVCVELPPLLEVPEDNEDPSAYDCDCYNNGIKGCRIAIERAGLKVKP